MVALYFKEYYGIIISKHEIMSLNMVQKGTAAVVLLLSRLAADVLMLIATSVDVLMLIQSLVDVLMLMQSLVDV
jgi:hypothetical protein